MCNFFLNGLFVYNFLDTVWHKFHVLIRCICNFFSNGFFFTTSWTWCDVNSMRWCDVYVTSFWMSFFVTTSWTWCGINSMRWFDGYLTIRYVHAHTLSRVQPFFFQDHYVICKIKQFHYWNGFSSTSLDDIKMQNQFRNSSDMGWVRLIIISLKYLRVQYHPMISP